MSRPFPLLLAAVPLLLIAGIALGTPVACPLILDDGAAKVARAPSGWTAVPAQAVRLSSGGLLRGRPEDWGYLRPERTATTRGGGSASNAFAPGEERWLWCGYGGAGALQIAKRLPDDATVCTVTHKATKRDGITEMSATCR
ncbi:MAG: hypothetical protein JWQ01_1134 [Massilia sp.]|nr:hypothetical protein [Massilia sp.]